MRIISVFFFFLSTLLGFSTFGFASFEQCDEAVECLNSKIRSNVCIQNNCVKRGRFMVTLSWTADVDLDLNLKTSKLNIISPDLGDNTTADGGYLVEDTCHKNCEEVDEMHPHIEHIIWSELPPKGQYAVWVDVLKDKKPTPFTIVVTYPDGRKKFFSGTTPAKKGKSVEFPISILDDDVCKHDSDRDGLCDSWEEDGMDVNGDGIIDLDLKALGAKVDHKDLFVEVDWIRGNRPRNLKNVKTAFNNANVGNPDKKSGIHLHIQRSDPIYKINGKRTWKNVEVAFSEIETIKFTDKKDPCSKDSWFGSKKDRLDKNCKWIAEARKKVFRYALFAFKFKGKEIAGLGEVGGNDFIITESGDRRTIEFHEATFLHEFGHTLNLRHGGRDVINCKPNYLSGMNYMFSDKDTYEDRPLDFSRIALPMLDENALDEAVGIQAPESDWKEVHWSHNGTNAFAEIEETIVDWNEDGTIDSNVKVNISENTSYNACTKTPIEKLHGYHDWANLLYNFRNSPGYSAKTGPAEFPTEMTHVERGANASRYDRDQDGVDNANDNCRRVANPGQEDRDNDLYGDACDKCPDVFGEDEFGCEEDWEHIDEYEGEPEETRMGMRSEANTDEENIDKDETDDDKKSNTSEEKNEEHKKINDAPEHHPNAEFESDEESNGLVNAKISACSTGPGFPPSLYFVFLLGIFGFRRRKKINLSS